MTGGVLLGLGAGASVVLQAVLAGQTMLGLVLAVVLALVVAVGVLCCRLAPEISLAMVVAAAVLHLALGVDLALGEIGMLAGFYGAARWGRRAVVLLGALAVPGCGAALMLAVATGALPGGTLRYTLTAIASQAGQGAQIVTSALVAMALFGAPWLVGLSLRLRARAEASEAAQEEAEEVARLARDVHDVVGHSLAVILAQAQAAEFSADDPERMRSTMRTIAESARSSLREVRQVLSATQDRSVPIAVPRFDDLIEGVRSSDRLIDAPVSGSPRPLRPEVGTVAHRVLQEMLTNALRHGEDDAPIRVEQTWPDDAEADPVLILTVSNASAAAGRADDGGSGLAGMRRRLASVGGRLDVRLQDEGGARMFTVTARIPMEGGR